MVDRSLPASFRDPSGFLFLGKEGGLYRQVNASYALQYEHLMASGLYDSLVGDGLLVEHEEAPLSLRHSDSACFVIRPRPLSFVSYPYEWVFGHIKAAALLTLEIQKRALAEGMSLKDCSAYNVQFEGVSPVFIDTLSFDMYREGVPWAAYGQFCRHFLAPLALISARDTRLTGLLRAHLDGIPLDLAARLLPWTARLRLGILVHLCLHAGAQTRHMRREKQGKKPPRASGRMSLLGLRGLVDSLESTVRGLVGPRQESVWADYADTDSYSAEGVEQKRRHVATFLERLRPKTVWDLGANTGQYSRMAAREGADVVSLDSDAACVERSFASYARDRVTRVLPLCMDLANPSPGLGWGHSERDSLMARGPVDLAMALALIHHLAIGNNVPFPLIADFLRRICRNLIIEFVPREDPQTQRLLEGRNNLFPEYTRENFEAAFGARFVIRESACLSNSGRVVYLMGNAS